MTDEIEKLLKENFKGYKKSNNPFQKILVKKENNKLLGLILYSIIYERAEIDYILVKQEYRGKHIGTKLLESAIEDIKRNNCINITLEVNVLNKEAIKLYEKNKFKIVKTIKNYYQNNDAYLMERKI